MHPPSARPLQAASPQKLIQILARRRLQFGFCAAQGCATFLDRLLDAGPAILVIEATGEREQGRLAAPATGEKMPLIPPMRPLPQPSKTLITAVENPEIAFIATTRKIPNAMIRIDLQSCGDAVAQPSVTAGHPQDLASRTTQGYLLRVPGQEFCS